MKLRRFYSLIFISLIAVLPSFGQAKTVTLSADMFGAHEILPLSTVDGWIFKQGSDIAWADKDLDENGWKSFKPTQLSKELEDPNGRIEGWFRMKIKLDESFVGIPLAISRNLWAATDVFLDGELIHSFGSTADPYVAYNPILKEPIPISLEIGKEYVFAIHFVDYETTFTQREIRLKSANLKRLINLTGPQYQERVKRNFKWEYVFGTLSIGLSMILFLLFWYLVILNPKVQIFKLIAWLTSFVLVTAIAIFFSTFFEISYTVEKARFIIMATFQALSTLFGLFVLEWMLTNKISHWSKIILILMLMANLPAHLFSISLPFGIIFIGMLLFYGTLLFRKWKTIQGAQWAVITGVVASTVATIFYISTHKYLLDLYYEYDKPLISMAILLQPIFLLGYVSARLNETLKEAYEEGQKVLKITEEKRELLANQNTILEKQVKERTEELNQSLENLKSTQTQLIQSEKMASLGELTAGIAHEIQNPLNFVNNFSDLNKELIDEQLEELEKGDIAEAKLIAADIRENELKINHHGKRAEGIVKSMLQHSRTGSVEKELTDINLLADEYLRLAYHGLRAKDSSFNADFKTELDPTLPKINVVSQDIGRVILNLINNAFQAVRKLEKPEVIVSTKLIGKEIQIIVTDNGPGIPDNIKEKIFQPFFTTKPTGEGTGLGLSMSYDIITKGHNGKIVLESQEGLGTKFIISIPTKIS